MRLSTRPNPGADREKAKPVRQAARAIDRSIARAACRTGLAFSRSAPGFGRVDRRMRSLYFWPGMRAALFASADHAQPRTHPLRGGFLGHDVHRALVVIVETMQREGFSAAVLAAQPQTDRRHVQLVHDRGGSSSGAARVGPHEVKQRLTLELPAPVAERPLP